MIGNLPVISVAFGPDTQSNQNRGRAVGLVAVGDVAVGIIAVGAIAAGVIAVGGLGFGVVSVGGVGLGLSGLGRTRGRRSGSRRAGRRFPLPGEAWRLAHIRRAGCGFTGQLRDAWIVTRVALPARITTTQGDLRSLDRTSSHAVVP